MSVLPTRARIVVIGGGVVGASTAYHLAHLGETDVVLLEQGTLSCGTTWHAAGLVGPLRASESGTRLVQYSADLYARLEAETGLSTGYKNVGGVVVARTPERWTALRRTAANAAAYGMPCDLLTPGEVAEKAPVFRTDDLLGGIWLPGDGTVNPADLTQSLARGARQLGVGIHERVRVLDVLTSGDGLDRRVTGVRTSAGDVECEVVVLCGGQWSKALAARVGAVVPLYPAEHFYVVTEPIAGVPKDLPVLRDPDSYLYVKEEVGGLVVGWFEPNAKPWVPSEEIPYPFEFQLLGEDWEHVEGMLEPALHRIPSLGETGIRKLYDGPESFTPDNQFVLGEAPQCRGFFVGAGFNSVGIASAGGAGKALAEWVHAGEPQEDLAAVDIRRFDAFHATTSWLRARVGEVLGLHYAIPWPNRELVTGRPQRVSPVHAAVAAAGGVFGTKMGWERPLHYVPASVPPPERDLTYGWDRQPWHDWCDAEQVATRSTVALFDQTSFGKLRITGSDSLSVLQRLCTADVHRAPGSVVYTGLLNQRGGYEADVTVTRVEADVWLLYTSAGSPVRDADWVRRHVRAGETCRVDDVTEDWAVLGLQGPRSRTLLERVTRDDVSEEGFGFATSRLLTVGATALRATRMTYVGELGWELSVPAASAAQVWDRLVDAGADLGLTRAGYSAMNALRLEKGYRAFGAELGPDRNPVEAGLLFTCKLRTSVDFVGREVVEQVRAQGPRRRLVSFVAQDPAAMLWGGELLRRDGIPVGQVTSVAPSARFGACVGLAWVWAPDGSVVDRSVADLPGYAVDVSGELVPVAVSFSAPLP